MLTLPTARAAHLAPLLLRHVEGIVIDRWRDHRIFEGSDDCRALRESLSSCVRGSNFRAFAKCNLHCILQSQQVGERHGLRSPACVSHDREERQKRAAEPNCDGRHVHTVRALRSWAHEYCR
jgi:hypothetical protein